MLIPASRLERAHDACAEAIALVPWSDQPSGAIVEFPSTTSAVDIIGALSDPQAHTRLMSMICVVDAMHVLDDLSSEDFLVTSRASTGQARDHIARALVTASQIEYSSMVVLVGWEALDTPTLSSLMALISHLSPHARLQLHRHGAELSLDPSPYSPAHERPGWVGVLNDDIDPHMTDPRVRTLHYAQPRPLHPGRLQVLLDRRIERGEFGRVVRSAGFCRFATRPSMTLQWEHVGRTIAFHLISADDALCPDEEPLSLGQDLAFIGLDLKAGALGSALDEAALSDTELAAGPQAWAQFQDPFPSWNPAEGLTG